MLQAQELFECKTRSSLMGPKLARRVLDCASDTQGGMRGCVYSQEVESYNVLASVGTHLHNELLGEDEALTKKICTWIEAHAGQSYLCQ
jgi:hypothetical protein